MSSKKKNQKTNPNKRKNDETVIICPYCGGTHFSIHDQRRVPSKWYVHVITAIIIISIAFVMPYFSIAFAIAYVVLTFMPLKVLVGTCKDVVRKRYSIARRMAA